jgi:DNA polymerase-1
VGEVTAKKFLKNTDPWRILANTDKLKGKMKENIEANKEKASYLKLATILLDCPVVFLTKRIMNYLLRCRKTDALLTS